jgi:integrase
VALHGFRSGRGDWLLPTERVRVARGEQQDSEGARVKALSEQQLRALLRHVPEEWRLFIEFLAHTGLRISEAIALEWRHIDLGRKRVLVRRRFSKGSFGAPKSRYGRRDVPLSAGMAQAL